METFRKKFTNVLDDVLIPQNRQECGEMREVAACQNTYLGHFSGTHLMILLQIQRFCLVFRNEMLQAFKWAVHLCFEVRWIVLILDRPTVGQTSESDHLKSTS